jgi:hypothetical protein
MFHSAQSMVFWGQIIERLIWVYVAKMAQNQAQNTLVPTFRTK